MAIENSSDLATRIKDTDPNGQPRSWGARVDIAHTVSEERLIELGEIESTNQEHEKNPSQQ